MKTLALALLGTTLMFAQMRPDYSTLAGSVKTVYNTVRDNVVKSAEKMPEDQYSFKPAEGVRTFGQLIGHLADANNGMCSASLGVQNPNPGVEKSKTSDKAYDITEAQAMEKIKFRNNERVRAGHLNYNAFHSNLHYGNLVTYLRLKGITPPSSDR
jgi:uncharacterized damage-inducible protein DinB